MPFRCKCGRTFEKTDSFASHTSACAPFHQRRMSEQNTASTKQQPPPAINTHTHSSSLSITGLLSPRSPPPHPGSPSSSSGSPTGMLDSRLFGTSAGSSTGGDMMAPSSAEDMTNQQASSMPSFFMPTGLSLHNAFEGARRRSMSYGSK
ncbi:hypothetical protein BCR43DRAFT_491860 [Syncephalastrum racemosum]|uniref:Uncharacterized protein n=1 Tax=Syncephalastrum racemosum TaxID=13706 RepID=A0A1X2HCN6_SYNRA|nr:hypothetical protein BCR43DRAFT_491860 [Syncephalastrum racemosum]